MSPSDADVRVALSTVADAESAGRIARALVEERLAACVNVVPGLRSVYRWQGALQEDAELLLVIKTVAARLDALAARLAELHPYDVPELVALPAQGGLTAYLDWVRAEVTP